MLKHSKKCLKNPYRSVDKKQKTLALGNEYEDDPNSVSFKLVEFNQEKTRVSLAKMIIIDELSFKFVENEGFRLFMSEAQPSRLATFKKCAKVVGVPSQAMIILDCQTRWNSTYLMLEVAEKYEQAFYRLEYDDAAYMITLVSESDGCPNESDWNRARVFLKFLKIFYDATLSFSGSLHVTANNFFKQLVDIQKALNRWRMSDDVVLQKMTMNMQLKFNRYWEGGMINYLLFVAVFLDPRYKFDYIEFCFSRMYDDKKCKEMMTKLKDIVNKLFEHYMVVYPVSAETSGSSTLASNISSGSNVGNQEDEEDWDGKFRLKMKKKQGEGQRNELERYLEDGVEETSPTFNILNWWKGKTSKYHVLSYMTRDILAIPVSTVSSESAFSTGGRVLDSFRSSLSPSTVEALICTQNWIKSPKVVDLEAELEEVQRIEEELLAATTDGDASATLNLALNTVTS